MVDISAAAADRSAVAVVVVCNCILLVLAVVAAQDIAPAGVANSHKAMVVTDADIRTRLDY